MSSLRDTFASASLQIQQEITQAAVKQIKTITGEVIAEIQEEYDGFFAVLHEQVLNAGLAANSSGMPRIFQKPGVNATRWHQVSFDWYEQKKRGSDPRSLDFYHGLTSGLIGSLRKTKRGLKSKKVRLRKGLSFDAFIQALALNGRSTVEEFFGPIQIMYSMTRPDGGKVALTSLDNVVSKIVQRNKKGGFASFLDGTTITTRVNAFSKVGAKLSERALLAHMVSIGGHADQWVKVIGGGVPREILLPLINYYVNYQFNLSLKDRFK